MKRLILGMMSAVVAMSASPTSYASEWAKKLKDIPLNQDGSATLSIDGSFRYRYENWKNFGLNEVNDETISYARLLLGAKFKIGSHVGMYIQGKAAPSTDRAQLGGRRAALDHDTGALQQAFLDFKIPIAADTSFTFRPGRQMLAFGKQRFVSPLAWSNTMRTWDGVSGIFNVGKFKAHMFYTQFVGARIFDSNKANEQLPFYGVYTTTKLSDTQELDIYWLGRDNEATDTELHTVGLRLGGKSGNWDYDLETAYQGGDTATGSVQASMIGSQLGYKFVDTKYKPRVWAGIDFGSGDSSPTDDTTGTLTQLFPLGHAYLGWADFLGRQNIWDYSFGVDVKPTKKLLIKPAIHIFRKAEEEDTIYNAGGGAHAGTANLGSKDVGVEYDIMLKYAFRKDLTGVLGYSFLDGGELMERARGATFDDIQFAYMMAIYKF